VVYSSFDGLGHYRQADLFGNFGAGGNRTTYVNYNPGQTFPGAFTPPAVSVDPKTGFLQRTRRLASAPRAARTTW
jgi:hypothetical protein